MFDNIYVLQVSKMRELLHARGDQVVSFSPMTPGAACAPHERWSAVTVDASTMNMRHSVGSGINCGEDQ